MKLVRIPDLSKYRRQVPEGSWHLGRWTRVALFAGGTVHSISDWMAKRMQDSRITILDPDPKGPDTLCVNGERYRGRFRQVRTGWILKDLGPHRGEARCRDLVNHYHCKKGEDVST